MESVQSLSAPSPPTTFGKAVITVLADARILLGAGTLLFPQPLSTFFGIGFIPSARIMAQMFAVRELGMATKNPHI
jgi:hypothetical protein